MAGGALSSGAAGLDAFRRFALHPWIERLEQARLLKGALALVTSTIVGVIANLSAWFALQVLFHALYLVTLGPIRLA